jgi:hypothetical protein
MEENNKSDINSQAVQSHLSITQSVIQRMATNCSSCKAWCITVVSAILVIVADKGKSQYAYIAIIPNILFLILDTYYLALEKMFRNSYNDFIKKLHENKLDSSDLFAVIPKGNWIKTFFKSVISFSVWPFYLTLFIMILLAKEIIL